MSADSDRPGAGLERALAGAAERGVAVEAVAQPPATSLEEAVAALGLTAREVVKTLVVKRSDGTFLFALVPGDRQISWPKLRAVVGVNRLQLPDAAQALEATGYERGAITPFGSTTDWPVFADATMRGRVAMGSGDRAVTLFADAAAIVAAYGATVADFTDPAAPRS